MEKGSLYFGSSEQGAISPLIKTTHTLFIDRAGVTQDRKQVGMPSIHYEDPSLPRANSVEHLDYTVIQPKSALEQPVEVALIGGLHADEEDAPMIAAQLFVNELFPRLESWNTHVAAGMLGRREWVRPIETGERVPKRERIRMKNSKEVSRGGVVGRKIDLNRQFQIPESVTTWDEAFASVTYPEARLLLTMMKDNPKVKYVFAFHEDPEFGHQEHPTPGKEQLTRDGIYFYDMPRDARTDTDKVMVDELKSKLAKNLTNAGFTMFHGIDDPNDPAIGYFADHGYIYQPTINEQGKRKLDGTFESAIVALGDLGLSVERGFSFEVPGGLSPERKTRILSIINHTFILPFLEAKGIRQRKGRRVV